MQISTGLLCLLLVVTAFTSQVLAHPEGSLSQLPNASTDSSSPCLGTWHRSIPASCCFVMTSKKIPKHLLKSYKKITNSRCTLKATVFRTKSGKDICADPKQKWVQDATKYLDQILRIPKP